MRENGPKMLSKLPHCDRAAGRGVAEVLLLPALVFLLEIDRGCEAGVPELRGRGVGHKMGAAYEGQVIRASVAGSKTAGGWGNWSCTDGWVVHRGGHASERKGRAIKWASHTRGGATGPRSGEGGVGATKPMSKLPYFGRLKRWVAAVPLDLVDPAQSQHEYSPVTAVTTRSQPYEPAAT